MVVNRAYIAKLVSDIRHAIKSVLACTDKPFDSMSEAEVYAVRYHLVVIAEALTALSLHIARRLFEEEPETPIHALIILRNKGMMDDEEYHDFLNLVKLRNLLVHRYWVIDDRRIYEAVRKDFKKLLSFVDRVIEHVK